MGLQKAFMSPERLILRASSALTVGPGVAVADAIYDLVAVRTVIRCAHANFIRVGIVYAQGAAGGAPCMIGEGFDGVTWERITVDNLGSLTVVPVSATVGSAFGTASLVDPFIKWFVPHAAIAENFVVPLFKSYIACRFAFAEYPIATQATPGTLSATGMIGVD